MPIPDIIRKMLSEHDKLVLTARLFRCPVLGLPFGDVLDALATQLERLYIDIGDCEEDSWGEAVITDASWSQEEGKVELAGVPTALCWELDYSRYNITSTPTLLLYLDDFRADFARASLDFTKPTERLSWDYRSACGRESVRQWLIDGLRQHCKGEPRWLPEYEGVVDWLHCNHGLGLILHGSCGLGKTLITTKLLPVFFYKVFGKIIKPYDARKLKELFASGSINHPIYIIDDVGEDKEENDYGTKRSYFAELMDEAEKRGTLVIVSSNLSREEFKRYGARPYDRLRSMCKRIEIRGESLRK